MKMQLLTDRVFETDNSIKLMNILCKTLSNRVDWKFCISKFITYDEFKIMIHTFIVEIMELFLEDNKYSDDTYEVCFKKLPRSVNGEFVADGNILVISDDVIKRIYNGKLDDLVVIFHELNHFKLKYDVLNGVINLDTCRIVKEMLIMNDDLNSSSYNNTFNKSISRNDFYYYDNYRVFSEEVIANIN